MSARSDASGAPLSRGGGSDHRFPIVYHHRTRGVGAEGVHIGSIVREWRALGHSVTVLGPQAGPDPTETAGQSPYGTPRGLRASLLAAVARRAPQLLFELAELGYNVVALPKVLRHLRDDGALLFERYAFFTVAGALAARWRGCAFAVEVNEVAGDARVRSQVLTSLARALEGRVFRAADLVVVVSEHLKGRVIAHGVEPKRVLVLPNAVDEVRFAPRPGQPFRQRHGIADDAVVVGFVGWFVPWHRLDRLVEAFARVRALAPEACLLLVGEGPVRAQVEALWARLGLGSGLIMTGALPFAEVPAAVAAMDVCVIPESNEFRSPLKLFEYLAMGRAVLAPRCEPVSSVFDDGEQVCLFASGDQADFVGQLLRLVQQPELRRALGDAGRARVLERHLWRHNAQAIVRALSRPS